MGGKEGDESLVAFVPGVAPGAHKRNIIVLLVYAFLLLMAFSLVGIGSSGGIF